MPEDPPFRDAVREHVEFGTRVAMQNSNATTEDHLHPLREVPPGPGRATTSRIDDSDVVTAGDDDVVARLALAGSRDGLVCERQPVSREIWSAF